MSRTALALFSIALVTAVAQDRASEEKEGFVPLIKESDWPGNTPQGWTLENGILRGNTEGQSPPLILKDTDSPEFELRFEAMVLKGALRVKLRGPATGPVGIAVEINTGKVEVVSNGMGVFVAAINRPGEWNEYRVIVRGSNLKLWKNGIPAPLEMIAGHMQETGKLSLHLSDKEPSDVSLRRLRIRP